MYDLDPLQSLIDSFVKKGSYFEFAPAIPYPPTVTLLGHIVNELTSLVKLLVYNLPLSVHMLSSLSKIWSNRTPKWCFALEKERKPEMWEACVPLWNSIERQISKVKYEKLCITLISYMGEVVLLYRGPEQLKWPGPEELLIAKLREGVKPEPVLNALIPQNIIVVIYFCPHAQSARTKLVQFCTSSSIDMNLQFKTSQALLMPFWTFTWSQELLWDRLLKVIWTWSEAGTKLQSQELMRLDRFHSRAWVLIIVKQFAFTKHLH